MNGLTTRIDTRSYYQRSAPCSLPTNGAQPCPALPFPDGEKTPARVPARLRREICPTILRGASQLTSATTITTTTSSTPCSSESVSYISSVIDRSIKGTRFSLVCHLHKSRFRLLRAALLGAAISLSEGWKNGRMEGSCWCCKAQ